MEIRSESLCLCGSEMKFEDCCMSKDDLLRKIYNLNYKLTDYYKPCALCGYKPDKNDEKTKLRNSHTVPKLVMRYVKKHIKKVSFHNGIRPIQDILTGTELVITSKPDHYKLDLEK